MERMEGLRGRCVARLRRLLPPFPEAPPPPPPEGMAALLGESLRPAARWLLAVLGLGLAAALAEVALVGLLGRVLDRLGAEPPGVGVLAGLGALLLGVPLLRAAGALTAAYILAPNLEARAVWTAHQRVLSAPLEAVRATPHGRIAERVAELGAALRSLAAQALDAAAFVIAYGLATLLLLGGGEPRLRAGAARLVPRLRPRRRPLRAARGAGRDGGGRGALGHGGPVGRRLRQHPGGEARGRSRRGARDGAPGDRRAHRHALRRAGAARPRRRAAAGGECGASARRRSHRARRRALRRDRRGCRRRRAGLSLRLAGMADMFLGLASGLFETVGLLRDAMRSACLPPETAAAAAARPRAASSRPAEVLRLEGLCFRRPADGALLGPFDARLARGASLGIAGPSGSGKSTLVGLILGFGRPESGRILLEGEELGRLAPDAVRRRIAVAPQQARLFRRSLRENLRHGCPEADEASVAEAIALAGLGPVVAEHGLDADVGEDGALLSGGERQRVLLARAVLKALVRDAPVLLLDEALSALDPPAAAAVLEALGRLRRPPAIVLVSHSPALLARMEQRLVIGSPVA